MHNHGPHDVLRVGEHGRARVDPVATVCVSAVNTTAAADVAVAVAATAVIAAATRSVRVEYLVGPMEPLPSKPRVLRVEVQEHLDWCRTTAAVGGEQHIIDAVATGTRATAAPAMGPSARLLDAGAA